jgi:hypothetical protein
MENTEKINKALLKYGLKSIERMAQVLQGTKLKNKIKAVVKDTEDGPTLLIEMPAYGDNVDRGIYPYGDKRPFKDLPKRTWKSDQGQFRPSISKWANSKRIRFNTVTDYSNYPSLTYSSKGFIPNKTRDFLIARSIVMRGIKPRPFIHLFYDHLDELNEELGVAFTQTIADNLRIGFEESGLDVS